MERLISQHSLNDLCKENKNAEGVLIYHEKDDYCLEIKIEPLKGGIIEITSPFGNELEIKRMDNNKLWRIQIKPDIKL